MKRDGRLESLWQSEAALVGHEIRSQEVEFDVVIAGAGITGVTTALMLQERGLKCAIAEARNMGFGTTGGTTAHLNNFFDASYDKVINDFGLDKARLLADAARDAPYRSYAMALKLRNGAYPRTLGYDMLEAYHYYRTHEVDGEE